MIDRAFKGKSIIEFPNTYVCIDVETTGLDYDSDEIIEVGAALVENGEIINTFSSFVKPKRSHVLLTGTVLDQMGLKSFADLTDELCDQFFSMHLIPDYITDLTGITNDLLLSAPNAEDILPKLKDFIGDNILIGHNIGFDVNFLYDSFQELGINLTNDHVNTMRISKKLFPELEHHRLRDIVDHLKIQTDNFHRAESDALTTIKCFESMKSIILQTQSFNEFKKQFSKFKKYKNSLSTVDEFDESNPIFGKVIVFTGTLSHMSRKDAFQIVANLGGIPENAVTTKTNFLIVGNEEFVKSVKNGQTSKMRKASNYQQKGLDILTLSEYTFFDMIEPYVSVSSLL